MKPALLLFIALFADFGKFWAPFQTAVAKSDAQAVAKMAHFPLNWELGKIREIKTESDFVKNFATYFPPEMRKAVATKKPDLLPNGNYIITWTVRGNEYSLYFKPERDTFVLDALSEGPA